MAGRCGTVPGQAKAWSWLKDDPVRICLDELRGSDEVGAAREMARERRAALLGREGVASGLVAVAMNADDGDRAQGWLCSER